MFSKQRTRAGVWRKSRPAGRTACPFRSRSVRGGSRRALTLLELLVVLVILAVVATAAVNSLQPRVETARFEQARSLIDNVRDAVIGQRGLRQPDGTPVISGFLADIGRLPKPPLANPLFGPMMENGSNLSELWDSESSLATGFPFRFRRGPDQPVDYSNIQLPCGWRGPYLHLPTGARNLLDPWGQPFQYELGSRGTIECIAWQPVGEYDTELKCGLGTGKVVVTGSLNFGQSEPSSVKVVMLGPDPDSSLSELTVFADEDNVKGTFTFSGVAVGLRALHITWDDRQMTRYLQVPQGGLTMAIDLGNTTSGQSP